MARGIVDCTGKQINIGDRVRTATGDVIEICGALVNEHRMFDAEKCELVSTDVALTNTGTVAGLELDVAAKKAKGQGHVSKVNGDCVVWGN